MTASSGPDPLPEPPELEPDPLPEPPELEPDPLPEPPELEPDPLPEPPELAGADISEPEPLLALPFEAFPIPSLPELELSGENPLRSVKTALSPSLIPYAVTPAAIHRTIITDMIIFELSTFSPPFN